MVQTLFGKDIALSLRTFRFSGDDSSSNQEQTIHCQLHLEPAADVSDAQAADCTCYTEEICSIPSDYTLSQESFGDVYYKMYDAMTFDDAKAQCESDGTHIAIPRSGLVLEI